ncbi:hypothetical protein [Mycobacterium sp. ITM-2016-00318]|uniref:hypothetical protein n=1 Tax=Mycobacterium sp. ITM-2016-00318 TaxID=2099693 RepID=UPI00115C224A|nr:hypothetical protein [Mycobacterium sp. ITM-2016-00318]WNG92648.1 hypothetical protein C6A82_025260 [Mycobacterium sp. ITM-2016-00318]
MAERNDAELVVDLAAAYGTQLDAWQIDLLEAGLGVRSDGSWAAKTVCTNISRQNGKSLVLTVRALAGALLFGERVIICSAHVQSTSRELFLNLLSFFENYTELSRRVKSVGRALGREEIWLKDGTHIFFPARTRSTLRGWSIDCYLADEAQLITDQQWESAKPAQSARPNAQVWLFGTAPQLTTDAEVFGRLRQTAHAGTDSALAWVEYGAQPGTDIDDRAQWIAANPGRVELEAMESERRELSPDGFQRERLNCWPVDQMEQVFDMEHWASLAASGPESSRKPSALAVDATPDRSVLSVAGAWLLDDDRQHVELLGNDYVADPLLALQWLVERAGRRVPIVIDGASPAASLIPALEAQKCKVITTTAGQMGRAAGGFLDAVVTGQISHADQPQLNDAAAGARKRPIQEAGLFGWDRRDGTVVVAPLVAATLARYGAEVAGRRGSGKATFA